MYERGTATIFHTLGSLCHNKAWKNAPMNNTRAVSASRRMTGPTVSIMMECLSRRKIESFAVVQKHEQLRWKSTVTDSVNEHHADSSSNGDEDKEKVANNITTTATASGASLNLVYQRVWRPGESGEIWTDRVVDKEDEESILFQIGRQELSGGRMKGRQEGVFHEDPVIDMRMMTHNYTVMSLASALRDREDALQQAAVLAEDDSDTGKQELLDFLKIYHPRYVLERREKKHPDITQKLDMPGLEWLRKRLMRMPRAVVSAHTKRASVVLPLCTIQGVPCLLLEKRAQHLRAHPDEVCLPGGMYCEVSDQTIVETSLREMKEEIEGLPTHGIQVLGVFRCNWGEGKFSCANP